MADIGPRDGNVARTGLGGEAIQGGLDFLESSRLCTAGLQELSHGIVRAKPSRPSDLPGRQLTVVEPRPEPGRSFGNAEHGGHHNAQLSEQSSAQKNARAVKGSYRHAVLMKLSTAEIIRAVIDRTNWPARRLAKWLGVSSNTPANWLSGKGALGDNLQRAATKLNITTDQLLGRETLPEDWLARIEFGDKERDEIIVTIPLGDLEGLMDNLARVSNEASRQQTQLVMTFLSTLRDKHSPPSPRKSG